MFERLKRTSFKYSLIWSTILLIGGAALCVFLWQNFYYSALGYADFATLAPDEIKSQLVDIELWENYGCFMESGTKNTTTQFVTITDYYYIIYTGGVDDIDSEYKYMAIKVPDSYESAMENMADNTYNGMLTSPITFSGMIRKMSQNEYSYFQSFWSEVGFTPEEIDEETLPYFIDVAEHKILQQLLYIGLFVLGAAMILWAVFRTIKAAGGGYLKKLRQDIASISCDEYTMEADFNEAAPFGNNDMIKVGRLFTYYNMNSTVPRAIPNAKIIWAYQSTTTHRTNGIKTATTHSITIFIDGCKGVTEIPVPNPTVAHLVLHRLGSTFPWIVVGYSDELRTMFIKDHARFLDIKYNTMEHNVADSTPAASTYWEN